MNVNNQENNADHQSNMPSDPHPETGQAIHHEQPDGLPNGAGRHIITDPSRFSSVNGESAQQQQQRQTPPASSHISLDGNLTHIRRRSAEVGILIFPRDRSMSPGGDGHHIPVTSTAAGTTGQSQGQSDGGGGRPGGVHHHHGQHQLPQPDTDMLLFHVGSIFLDDERLIRHLVHGARRRLSLEAAGRSESADYNGGRPLRLASGERLRGREENVAGGPRRRNT